jgi:hypothetical protein
MYANKELDLLGLDQNGTKVDLCVVYNEATGEIIHSHQIVTLPGATPPTEKELEDEALTLASGNSNNPKIRMAVLPVRIDDFRPDGIYKVNLDKKCLVKVPAKTTKPKTKNKPGY